MRLPLQLVGAAVANEENVGRVRLHLLDGDAWAVSAKGKGGKCGTMSSLREGESEREDDR